MNYYTSTTNTNMINELLYKYSTTNTNIINELLYKYY